MMPIAFLASTLAPAMELPREPSEAIEARWNLTEGAHHRWEVDTRIAFPGHAWLVADRNEQVRVPDLTLKAVVDCTVDAAWNDRGALECSLADVALIGRTFPGDHGRLQVVLDELDAKLTDARVGITMKANGRITDIELELNPVSPFVNRRTRETDQFVRMIVVRALAPLDFRIPDGGFMPGQPWMFDDTRVIDLPVTRGSMGDARLMHAAAPADDTRVVVRSEGPIVMQTGNLVLKGTTWGSTAFDHARGTMDEAFWRTETESTPMAGPFGRPYRSTSWVRTLYDGEQVQLPATQELLPDER